MWQKSSTDLISKLKKKFLWKKVHACCYFFHRRWKHHSSTGIHSQLTFKSNNLKKSGTIWQNKYHQSCKHSHPSQRYKSFFTAFTKIHKILPSDRMQKFEVTTPRQLLFVPYCHTGKLKNGNGLFTLIVVPEFSKMHSIPFNSSWEICVVCSLLLLTIKFLIQFPSEKVGICWSSIFTFLV